MRLSLLLLSLCLSQILSAQSFSTYGVEERACNNTLGTYMRYFDLFQTENDSINGEHIEICNPLTKINNYIYGLVVDSFNIEKPIFMRLREDSLWVDPNKIFDVGASLGKDYRGGACDTCSSIHMNLYVPSEDSTFYFTYKLLGQDSIGSYYSDCIASEKIPGQFIGDVYMKLYLDTDEDVIRLPYFNLNPSEDYYTIMPDTVTVLEYYDTVNDTTIRTYSENLWNYMLPFFAHYEPGYPSDDNKSYYEIRVNDEDINAEPHVIELESYNNIVFQNFTELRGGLTADSTQRHRVNLRIMNGMCLSIAEVVFNGTDITFANDSELAFSSKNSCIQLNHGTLHVDDQSTLRYGYEGRGMLAIHQGGAVHLRPSSTLIFDGVMMIFDNDGDIYLDEEATLKFTKEAQIQNLQNPDKKVNIYVGKGTVDLSDYTDDMSKINLIFDESPEEIRPVLHLYPNPAQDRIFINGIDHLKPVSVYDLSGKHLLEVEYDQRSGMDVSSLERGWYVVKSENQIGKLIKE